jgi:chemotaxis protein MotC
MTLRTCIFALVAMWGLSFHAAWANSPLQFRNSIRTLEALQDATAMGDPLAADLQAKLTTQVEADLKNAQKADLRNAQNLRAIAVYLFIGGNPDAAERRLTSLNIDPDLKNLLDGALAYTRGDKVNATKFLDPVNPAELPANLGGRVALVKAILASAQDLKAALKLLNIARGLMPGTLVEEAALRRCINFSGKALDIAQLENCASLYIRRFSKSIYAGEFNDSFITSLIEVDYLNKGGSTANLDVVLGDLTPPEHRKFLLAIARVTLNHGRFELAKACAGRALEMSRAGSAEMVRSKLYLAAAQLAKDEFQVGIQSLGAINRAALDADDTALLDKALNLAAQIIKQPEISKEKAIVTLTPEERSAGQTEEYTKLLSRAQNALADPNTAKVN